MNTLEQVVREAKRKAKEVPEKKPLLDVEATRAELLQWLAEVKLPPGNKTTAWDGVLQDFPGKPEEVNATSGVRLRLALPLATKENKYLIAILECLELDSRGTYLICVYVNWKAPERQMQKLVEEGYRGHFDDVLRGRHTLWAQTFRSGELTSALACCSKAILSKELVSRPEAPLEIEKLRIASPAVANFPKPDDA